jgi:hypothetical protein
MTEHLTILEFNAQEALGKQSNATEAEKLRAIDAEWAQNARTAAQGIGWCVTSLYRPDVAAIPCAYPQDDALDPNFIDMLSDGQYSYIEGQAPDSRGLVLAVKKEKLVSFSSPINLLGGVAIQAMLTTGNTIVALELDGISEEKRVRQTEKLLEIADPATAILAGAFNSMHREAFFSRLYRTLLRSISYLPPHVGEQMDPAPQIPPDSVLTVQDIGAASAWGVRYIKHGLESFLKRAEGGPLQLLKANGYHDATTKYESTIEDVPGGQVDHIMLPASMESVPRSFKTHWMRNRSQHHALMVELRQK